MIHTMIMAGGKGSRFWPFSRLRKPKQFLSILSDDSLLNETIQRVSHFSGIENCWLLANHEQKESFIHDTTIPKENILLEPFAKNTAACIIWAAFEAMKRDPEAILLTVSADAWISNQVEFNKTIQQAIEVVKEENSVMTIGIKPRFAHTGYGYIKVDDKKDTFSHSVLEFKEKPTRDLAEQYIESGRYFWNAGIFVWKASHLLELAATHLPDHYRLLKSMTALSDLDNESITSFYEQLDPISIDHGLLEKIPTDIKLIPASFEWDDIGSWSSLERYLETDKFHNVIKGKAITMDSHRNIIFSNKKLIALAHVNDSIIIDTDDALLIIPKEYDQDLKQLYELIPDAYK